METLARRLEAFREGMLERADPALFATLGRHAEGLIERGVAYAALPLGDVAPDFTLPQADGGKVALREVLAKGPVVLVFYRGSWCPFCTLSLRALADSYPKLRALGAEVLAISPELPRRRTAGCAWLPFPLLHDHDNAVARRYGLAVALPEEVQAAYRRLGHDLAASNGVPAWEMPMPAGFVLAPDGRVALRQVDPRTHYRLEPADAVAAVAALAQPAR